MSRTDPPLSGPSVRTVSGQLLPRGPVLSADAGPGGGVEKRCPVCGKQGRKVTALTVTAHLRSDFWSSLGDGFWFCWTPECPMMYYDNARRVYVSKDPREVRSRFGLKESASPRPICYCLGVTEERLLEEVVEKRCCDSFQDVERFTRAGTGKWCLTTNPSGVCCRVYLKDVVDRALEHAHAQARPSLEQVSRSLETAPEVPAVETELGITGMHCESCTVSVAAALEHAGALEVEVSYSQGRARLLRPKTIPVERLVEAVTDAGYSASERSGGGPL